VTNDRERSGHTPMRLYEFKQRKQFNIHVYAVMQTATEFDI